MQRPPTSSLTHVVVMSRPARDTFSSEPWLLGRACLDRYCAQENYAFFVDWYVSCGLILARLAVRPEF